MQLKAALVIIPIFNFLNFFYAQMIEPPSLSLLLAVVLHFCTCKCNLNSFGIFKLKQDINTHQKVIPSNFFSEYLCSPDVIIQIWTNFHFKSVNVREEIPCLSHCMVDLTTSLTAFSLVCWCQCSLCATNHDPELQLCYLERIK